MGRLDGKIALITGGGRGMGQSHAVTLAREGADIIIIDAPGEIPSVPYGVGTEEDLASVKAEVEALDRRCIAAAGDVRDQARLDEIVAEAIAEFGGIDICVANAGIWSVSPYWEMSDQTWDEMVGINLTGVWRTAKAVTPSMIERDGGAIVLISSINGIEPNKDFAHYTAAKAGVIGLMMAIAYEGGPLNIRCNAILPGVVDTPMNSWQGGLDLFAGHEGGTMEDRARGSKYWSALRGRGILPRSAVSEAILWMVADSGADITGLTVPIDGGHSILPRFNGDPVLD
jgi:SDR family mycofactocin-dependent oxidoreductase